MSHLNAHTNRTNGHTSFRTRTTRMLLVGIAAAPLAASFSAGHVAATMTSAAVVECDTARNTIQVTPRVLSDHADQAQHTATRIWIATWDPAGQVWSWETSPWNVETARASNDVIAIDIARLQTRVFSGTDGSHHYVYVESYMWDGSTWTDHRGEYTRSYTLLTPSVSHEPDSRVDAAFCTL